MGRRAVCVRADLASEEEARGLLDTAVAALGPVDVLVNNASVFTESRLADFDPGELCLNMDVHAVAPLMLSRAFAAQGRPGCILNMLDSRITDYDERHAAYHLSKRALFTLTRMSALEFAPLVRVNGIAPGLILPPEGKDEGYLEELAHTNPLNSYGGEDDIACAALYLLASRFVTGQVLYVDGGRHLKGNTYGA
jgi:NAD(P)-dependent dehydrogenase (short-subunit alcohol dehydrogenase family)